MSAHAKLRAKERYGVDLSNADLANLRCAADMGDAVLVTIEDGGNNVVIVMHGGVALRMVYNPRTGGILTFLPQFAKTRKPRSGKIKVRKIWRDGRLHVAG